MNRIGSKQAWMKKVAKAFQPDVALGVTGKKRLGCGEKG
jgi:hypothetical protein